jgi:hypothetical protein
MLPIPCRHSLVNASVESETVLSSQPPTIRAMMDCITTRSRCAELTRIAEQDHDGQPSDELHQAYARTESLT